jgi:Na+/melibiose symporter-like transporter
MSNSSASFNAVFTTYLIITISAAASISVVQELKPEAVPTAAPVANNFDTKKLTATVKLLLADAKMPLVMGMCLSFGVASAFLNSYLNGHVVAEYKGNHNIGYYASITPAVAGGLAPLLSWIGSRFGKYPVMMIGSVGFMLSFAGPLFLQPEVLSTTWVLVCVYAFEATGRCVAPVPMHWNSQC